MSPAAIIQLVADLRTGGHWFVSPAQPIFFLRINDCHSDRINFSLNTVHCFNDSYVAKQTVAWKVQSTGLKTFWLL